MGNVGQVGVCLSWKTREERGKKIKNQKIAQVHLLVFIGIIKLTKLPLPATKCWYCTSTYDDGNNKPSQLSWTTAVKKGFLSIYGYGGVMCGYTTEEKTPPSKSRRRKEGKAEERKQQEEINHEK